MATDLRPPAAPPRAAASSNRRGDIQGLRAVAVLLVVAFHAQLPLPGGFVGVDVFFAISGFVITAMLMREWAATGRIAFRHFYFRRFLRLTPALALTVTVVAAASILLQNPFGAQQTTARTGLGAMFLSANFAIAHAAGDYFAANSITNPLLNTWSLSVEEQFYLAFPALFVLGWTMSRRSGRPSRALLPPTLIVGGIAVLSFGLSTALSYGSTIDEAVTSFFGGPQSTAFYSPFTRAWEFAVGALLALLISRIPRLSTAAAHLVGLAGIGLIAAAALVIDESMPFPGYWALLPVLGAVLVILAGSTATSGVSRVLSTRPMVFVGDISYSWYLWHWPLIVFAALLFPNRPLVLIAAAIASLVPALLSYRFVEQPIRRMRPRTRPRAAALVSTTVGIPVAMCLVLLMGANAGWGLVAPASAAAGGAVTGQGPPAGTGSSAPGADSAAADGEVAGGEGGSLRAAHAAVRAGCVNTPLNPRKCRFGPQSATRTVLLAGDSQSYALADGVIAAAESLGMAAIVTSHTGCPFLDRESSGVHNYPCRSWQKSIVEYALRTKPDAVLIGNLSTGYVHPETGWRTAERDGGGRAESADEAEALWRKGLEPIVAKLRRAGIGVVLIATVPQMHGYTDGTTLLSQAFGSADFEISRSDTEAERQPALDVESAIAKAWPGTVVYDPNPALCDDDVCAATRDGTPRYQDETHLSVPGSLLLTDGLSDAISRAVAESSPPRR